MDTSTYCVEPEPTAAGAADEDDPGAYGHPDSETWDRAQKLGATAAELVPFQDEPAQMGSAGVGKNGFLRLGFARRGLRTGMVDVERRVPFLVQRALYWDEALPDMACVYLITTSGGILQGDRYSLEIDVGADARVHLTTQGSTKIQSMDTNYAAQAQTIRLHENAYLEFLPEPIIPFRRSRFITDTRIERDPAATLLYSEILVPGRRYHHPDECFGFDVFSSRVRAWCERKLAIVRALPTGVLISWATPATSLPNEASRSFSMRCCWVCWSSR